MAGPARRAARGGDPARRARRAPIRRRSGPCGRRARAYLGGCGGSTRRSRAASPRSRPRSASSSRPTTRSATTRAATGSRSSATVIPRARPRPAVGGRDRGARADDPARRACRRSSPRAPCNSESRRRSRARPARTSARALWADSLGPRARTARPTSARSRPTRTRWSKASSGDPGDCLADVRRSRPPTSSARSSRSCCWPCSRACSGRGSCCGGCRSSPTRSARRRSPGSWSPGRGGSRRSSRRSAPRSASRGLRERLQRAGASRHGRRHRAPARRGARARRRCWPRDVYRSGAGVDRLLFGTLIGLSDRDLVAHRVAAALALAADAALRRAWLARASTPRRARALGVPVSGPDRLLLAAVAGAVIVALAAVGALLVTVVLVVPAATVRLVRATCARSSSATGGARRGRGRGRAVGRGHAQRRRPGRRWRCSAACLRASRWPCSRRGRRG